MDTFVPGHGSVILKSDREAERHTKHKDVGYCPNCKNDLEEVFSDDHDDSESSFYAGISIHSCINCGWWIADRFSCDFETFPQVNSSKVTYATLKTFKDYDKDPYFLETTKELKKNPARVRKMHPTSFEKYAADVIASIHNCEAVHVGKTADGGIDAFLLLNDDKPIIQVKRREKENAVESVKTIRELVGTMVIEDNYKGIIISTAKQFSKPAVKTVNELILKNKVERLDLYDFKRFFEMVDLVHDNKSKLWEPIISKYWQYR